MLHFRSGMSIPVRSVVWALSLGAAISAIGPLAARPAPRSIAPTADAQNSVTFNRDIAPIIFHSCSTCHRPGEAAPFSSTDVFRCKKARTADRGCYALARDASLASAAAGTEVRRRDAIVRCRNQLDPAMGRAGRSRGQHRRSASASEVRGRMDAGQARPGPHSDKATDASATRHGHVLEFHFSGSDRAKRNG